MLYKYLLSSFCYVFVVMIPEVEMMIERSRKFAVLAGLFVSHLRYFATGPKASICADNSL